MRKLSLISALISALSIHAAFAAETSTGSSKTSAVGHAELNSKEKISVEKVVLAYVCIDEDKLCDKGMFKGHVQVIKIFETYAKVKVIPDDGQVDAEWVYLKKDNAGWDVLDSGTGVNPMELGIPKEAW